MAGDPLQHVQLDAGVGHPRERCVSEPVADQPWQPQLLDKGVPSRGISQSRCGEDAAAWSQHQSFIRESIGSQTLQGRAEGIDDRYDPGASALGGLGDQAAATGVGLSPYLNEALLEDDVADVQPGTSLIRRAVVARIVTVSP